MVSVGHANAPELFDRDAENLERFFESKLGYAPPESPGGSGATGPPALDPLRPRFAQLPAASGAVEDGALDEALRASGFQRKDQQVCFCDSDNPPGLHQHMYGSNSIHHTR